jgi:hypothetical protein
MAQGRVGKNKLNAVSQLASLRRETGGRMGDSRLLCYKATGEQEDGQQERHNTPGADHAGKFSKGMGMRRSIE